MKHKTHTVKVFVYNPYNLKEVINKIPFTIKYIPTKKWNVYLILINDKYCGINVNIVNILQQNSLEPISIRKLIAESIVLYSKNEFKNYQNRVKVSYKNDDCFKLSERIFKEILLNIGDFKSREELTKYNLIWLEGK